MPNVQTQFMFNRNSSLEKNRRSVPTVTFVVLVSWFIFTLFICCALISYLHIKFSQDLAQKVAGDMRNFKGRIQNTLHAVINKEIVKINIEIEARLSNIITQQQSPFIVNQYGYQTFNYKQITPLNGITANNADTSEEDEEYNDESDEDDDEYYYYYNESVKSENKVISANNRPPWSTTLPSVNTNRQPSEMSPDLHLTISTPESSTFSDEEDSEYANDDLLSRNVTSSSRVFKRSADISSPRKSVPPVAIGDLSKNAKDKLTAQKDVENVTLANTFSRSNNTPSVNTAVQGTHRVDQKEWVNISSFNRDAIRPAEGRHQRTKSKRNDHLNENKIDVEDEDLSKGASIESSNLKSGSSLFTKSELERAESAHAIYVKRIPEEDLVAVHFGADSSNFKAQKMYYKQNDMVRHPTGEYREWKFDNWHHEFHMFKHFNYTNGRCFIQNTGLYFVYGQIYFTEWADINGFKISKNNETVLQCVTSIYGDKNKGELSNTCFTGGIVFFKKGDEVKIQSFHPGRYVVLEATKSFFGMFKIAESQQIKIFSL